MSVGRVSLLAVRYAEPPGHLLRLARSFAFSARAAGADPEVVVWDNSPGGPDPALAEALADALPGGRASVHGDGTNTFHSGGTNAAARRATGEVLVLANPDLILGRDAVRHLVEPLDPRIPTAVEGRQLPLDHPKAYDPVALTTSWASGALLALRREVFADLGGFDAERFPMYCNDVDLSWRLRAAGGRVLVAPDAVAWHDKRLTASYAVEQTPHEASGALLAHLVLARRWGGARTEQALLAAVSRGGDARQLRQVEQFHLLVAGGGVEPLPERDLGAADLRGLLIGENRY